MKLILMLFLIFTATKGHAIPNKVISFVCGHKYTEGKRKERPNGQVLKECLYKKTLPTKYEADIRSACHGTHAEGIWKLSSNGFPFKECLKKDSLRLIYATYYLNKCEPEYRSEIIDVSEDYDYPYVMCVKKQQYL